MFIVVILLVALCISDSKAWPCNICGKTPADHICKQKLENGSWDSNRDVKLRAFHAISGSIKTIYGTVKGMHNEITLETCILTNSSNVRMDCPTLLVQKVPKSFYVDQYEVHRLDIEGVHSFFERNINVELPEYLSQDEIVLHYLQPRSEACAKFSIPWHSRYHRCAKDFYNTSAYSSIPSPILYSSCSEHRPFKPIMFDPLVTDEVCQSYPNLIVAPCYADKQIACFWMPVAQRIDTVSVSVPIGQCNDGPLVATLTLLSTFAGNIIVCYFLWAIVSKKANS